MQTDNKKNFTAYKHDTASGQAEGQPVDLMKHDGQRLLFRFVTATGRLEDGSFWPTGLVDASLGVAPVLLAQHELLQLPGGRARQRIDQLHRCRTLEVGQPLAAEGEHLLRVGSATGSRND